MRNCWTEPPNKEQIRTKLSKINLRQRLGLKIHSNFNQPQFFGNKEQDIELMHEQLYPQLNERFQILQKKKSFPKKLSLPTLANINRPKQIGLTIVMLIGIFVIIAITVQWKLTSESCYQRYQDNLCWLDSNNSSAECKDLQKCISSQDSNLKEYIFTVLAGVGLLMKKYWREINIYVARHND